MQKKIYIRPKEQASLYNANITKPYLVFKNKLKSGFYYRTTFWILLKLALEYPSKLSWDLWQACIRLAQAPLLNITRTPWCMLHKTLPSHPFLSRENKPLERHL